MKERPILWSAPMVLALLAGRKTQTRRILKAPHIEDADVWVFDAERCEWESGECHQGPTAHVEWVKPYAIVGDRLWGRETFALCEAPIRRGHYQYAADGALGIRVHDSGGKSWWERSGYTVGITRGEPAGCWVGKPSKWKPSIFMPREASRLLHEVTAVRVERLQDITEEDALAEGIIKGGRDVPAAMGGGVEAFTWPGAAEWHTSARAAYLAGWNTINGNGSAATNPWVWVVALRPVSA